MVHPGAPYKAVVQAEKLHRKPLPTPVSVKQSPKNPACIVAHFGTMISALREEENELGIGNHMVHEETAQHVNWGGTRGAVELPAAPVGGRGGGEQDEQQPS